MPTLIGRFNELLHNFSSSTSATQNQTTQISSSSSSARQHHHPPSRSSSNRIVSTGDSSKRQIVKRSSSSRPQQSNKTVNCTNHDCNNNNNNHRHGSLIATSGYNSNNNSNRSSLYIEQEKDKTGNNRNRASSHINDRPKQQTNPSYRLSSSKTPSTTTTKQNTNQNIQKQHQKHKSRQNHQRRHSIASVSSMSNNIIHNNNKISTSHHNNNNKYVNDSKGNFNELNHIEKNINQQNNSNINDDESLTKILVRKMKIGAITKKNPNNNNNNQLKTEIFHKKIFKMTKKEMESHHMIDDGDKLSKGCFINHYLDGHLIKNHPDIISGKTCYDMPVREIELLETNIVAACTGPNDGLLTVNSSSKPFEISLDDGIDFIDEDYPDSSLSSNGCCSSDHNQSPQNSAKLSTSSAISSTDISIDNNNKPNKSCSPVNNFEKIIEPVAGVNNWNRFNDFAYGISTTLYETHPSTKQKAGDPIADSFAICLRENSAIIALADGVNWGEKACLASRCAIHGCIDYLNKALYSAATDSTRSRNTMDIFIALLRSFNAAHNMILAQGGHLTTLCAAVICQLKDSDRFIVCTCNVGDSLAYVYSQQHGVREITQGSHDIFSMRDMRDALGALGPVSGSEPELNNLTVAMTIVDVGDIVFLTSDGISDNFDPVVGKFAIPKKDSSKNNNDIINDNNNNNNITNNNESCGKSKKNNDNDIDCGKTSLLAKGLKVRKMVQRSNSNPEKYSARYLNYTSKGLPLVSAQQRHALTLLRMEDLIMNGVNGNILINGDDYPSNNNNNDMIENRMITAKDLCLLMVDFSTKLTIAKRRILEDPELYSDDDDNNRDNDEIFDKQRRRRRMVGQKLAQLPGKLDHASIAAIQVGFYGKLRKTKQIPSAKHYNHYQHNSSSKTQQQRNDDSRYNLRTKATLARFESQDSLESINESGPI